MADKTDDKVVLFGTVATGQGERCVLYGIPGVTTGDTVNLAAEFSKVKDAYAIVAGSNADMNDIPAWTPPAVVLTFDQAAWAGEYIYLTVVGNAP